MDKTKIHIGTSGWHYGHWVGPFYPEKTAKSEFLTHYQSHFDAVEINNFFYRLPSEKTLKHWREAAGPEFTFTAKASRYITHMKKLKDPEDAVSAFFERIDVLSPKLGPILFQLPPNWRFDPERLERFLTALPPGHRYTFEFRDTSWFADPCLEILARHGAAFCIYHLAGELSPRAVTADFIYVRLHGPGDAYQGRYEKSALAAWAGAFSTWSDQGKEIFCFFDNDQKGFAAVNALELKEMVEGNSA
ncbi:MAG: DUF72 domain-containing protein [Desulfobacterales bacterium]|nr:DUF72 domain-containing protein [Desulfobacterales bacterium]